MLAIVARTLYNISVVVAKTKDIFGFGGNYE